MVDGAQGEPRLQVAGLQPASRRPRETAARRGPHPVLLAGLVGVRREHVNRLIAAWKREGALDFQDGNVTVLRGRLLRSVLGIGGSLFCWTVAAGYQDLILVQAGCLIS